MTTKKNEAAVRDLGDGTYMIHAGSREHGVGEVTKALDELKDAMHDIRSAVAAERAK